MAYLDQAMDWHRKGMIDQAKQTYMKAFNNDENGNPILYQNLGALLRKDGREAEAINVYKKGLNNYPNDIGITLNYSNIIRTRNPSLSIFLHLKVIRGMIREKYDNEKLKEPILFLASTLDDLGLYSWAYTLLRYGIGQVEDNCILIANLLILIDKHTNHFKISVEKRSKINDLLEKTVSKEDLGKQIEIYYAIANSCILARRLDDSIRLFKKANSLFGEMIKTKDNIEEIKKLSDRRINSNWNYSNALLKQGEFKEGWKLFDYGLITHAEGIQKWQRAMFKPFNNTKVNLWRGEELFGKHLLMLEEQAVGDSMMFLTLMKPIIDESKKVTLVISKRLVPIYIRSLSHYIKQKRIVIMSQSEFIKGKYKSSAFDLQAPMASICQYRFSELKDYGKYCPNIKANIKDTKTLKTQLKVGVGEKNKIIGLSWRGGAKGQRLLQKSLPISFFANMIKDFSQHTFVSLQYGCTKQEIQEFAKYNIKVINLTEINPLVDMDRWISLVNCCDLVISIANTTIHGAGSLGIPTKCMLSNFSDWRWLSDKNLKSSYWYPSVDVSHQSDDGKWYNALAEAKEWLESHS